MLLCTKLENTSRDQDGERSSPTGKPRDASSRERIMEINLFDLQILLAIASLQPEAYGTTILEEINKHTQRLHWPGRAYAALERLQTEGLVRKTLESSPTPKRGGRRKTMLHLTTAGKSTLAHSLNSIDALRGVKVTPTG